MLVTVKTHKRKTTNVNYLQRLWQKSQRCHTVLLMIYTFTLNFTLIF